MEKMSLTEKEQERQLIEGLIYADRFINRQYLSNIDVHTVQRREENYAQMRLFRLSKLVFDVNENTNDKLISVYGALNSIGATGEILNRNHLKSSLLSAELQIRVMDAEHHSRNQRGIYRQIDSQQCRQRGQLLFRELECHVVERCVVNRRPHPWHCFKEKSQSKLKDEHVQQQACMGKPKNRTCQNNQQHGQPEAVDHRGSAEARLKRA